jgi:hypothetical protein
MMFHTMDAYDRADLDRLAEIYAEDAQWRNADPNRPPCRNRHDIFAMFRQRRDAGIRIGFDELALDPEPGRADRPGERLGPGGHRVQLRGTLHRQRPGLPVDGGRRGSPRRARPGTGGAVVAPVATRFSWLMRSVVSGAAPLRCRPAGRCR